MIIIIIKKIKWPQKLWQGSLTLREIIDLINYAYDHEFTEQSFYIFFENG